MAKPSLTDLATRALKKAHRAPTSRDDAELLVARMEQALAEQKRVLRTRVTIAGGLAIAAAIALFVGFRARHSEDPVANTPKTVSSALVVLQNGEASATSVHKGESLEAKSDADLAVLRGSHLLLAAGSTIAVEQLDETQIYSLPRGRVRADVKKLAPGERFVVRTSDTEVEVRGTSFIVEKRAVGTCHPGLETYVEVREGVVVVRHAGKEDRVTAGQSWPSKCEEPAPNNTPSPTPPTPSAKSTTSPTDGANDLYAQATEARKRGDLRVAVSLLDRLIATYPASPLVETARVERFRALSTFDAKRAAAAARDYVAHHPRGFARAEADSLLSNAP